MPHTQSDIRTEFVTANGLSFEVQMCGEGRKLALCLHGFPEHAHSWRYQLPLLAQMGYQAWAPNLRGYGNSGRPRGVKEYSIDNLMADVAGLIDVADADDVTLIAHDWGAIVAWNFAMAKIRPLKKLIIMNVPHPGATQSNGVSFAQLRKSWYIFFFQIPFLPELALRSNNAALVGRAFIDMAVDKSKFPDEVLDVYRANALRPGGATAMVNYYRALLRKRVTHPALKGGKLPAIETPTLMVWGEEDAALGKELTYGTDKFVRNLTIRYLPMVSHWVQQEAPETVNGMLEDFLNDRQVREAPGVEQPAAA
jgi:pimeloyl-ACP methyl ester carboxylesterase